MRYHAHHCLAPTFDPSNTFPEPSGDPKNNAYPPPRCHHRPAFRFPSLRPKRRVRGKVTPWLRHSVHKKSQSRCAQIAVHSTAVAHPGFLLLGVGLRQPDNLLPPSSRCNVALPTLLWLQLGPRTPSYRALPLLRPVGRDPLQHRP